MQELVEAGQRRGALAHHHVHDEVDEVGGDAEPLDVAAVALLIDLARPHQGDLGEGPGPEIRIRLVLLAIGFGVTVDVGGDHGGDGDEVGANSTSKCNSRLKIRLLSEVRQKPPVAV